jgi:polyferredoxin
LELDVIRDRNALYRTTSEGLVENVYTLKILNMDDTAHNYRLSISGLENSVLAMDKREIRANAGEVVESIVRLQIDPYDLKRQSNTVEFNLVAEDDDSLSVSEEARFLGPGRR